MQMHGVETFRWVHDFRTPVVYRELDLEEYRQFAELDSFIDDPCMDESPLNRSGDYFVCTLEIGHPEPHVAQGFSFPVCAIWNSSCVS